MTEALDDAVGRQWGQVGTVIFNEHQAGFCGADFGDCGGDRARQRRAARDRSLDRRTAGRHRIDQIGIDEQRRQRQHRRGDARLVGGKRENDRRRRIGARGERVGERAAHQRRRIVEQHQHGALGGAEVVGRQIGIEEGARQRAGRFGPPAGRSGAYPLKKMADDHCSFTQHRIIAAPILNRARLTKRSP